MKNLLVAQSGGPTAAINATLCGVIEKGLLSKEIGHIYGAKNGVAGILDENFLILEEKFKNTGDLQLLCQTPSAALGSTRTKLADPDKNPEQFDKIISVCRKYDIGYFVYIGGNDSMDTVYKLSEYLSKKGIEDIKVVGAPKTIDNDLMATDHCPGFGSAAKYIATTFAELCCDCNVYTIPAVTIVEVMGRDAGWLTAASALARINGGTAPDLIYLCERPFDTKKFIEDVRMKLEEKPAVVVAVSEGIHNADGVYVAEAMQSGAVDAFGHKILAGAAICLEELVKNEIGCKVRSIALNLMQRCAAHIGSATDLYESRLLGLCAADCALNGGTGVMAGLKRKDGNDYQVEIAYFPIAEIANQVKRVPLEWINEAGNDVTPELVSYLLPLIQGEPAVAYQNGIPKHIKLY